MERSVPGAGLWAQKAKGYERAFLGDENVLYHDYDTGYLTVFFQTHSNCIPNNEAIYCM